MASNRLARERALGVSELLEGILLSLPMRDVLLSQRVSKTWQANIRSSTSLQQKLFFQNEHTLPARLVFYSNPAIDSEYTLWTLDDYKEEIYDGQPSEERTEMLKFMWHSPSAPRVPKTVNGNPVFSILENYLNTSFKTQRPDPTIELPQSWTRPEASWRKMLLSQQPIQSRLEFTISGSSGSPGYSTLFLLPTGAGRQLRLGDIMEKLCQETGALHWFVTSMCTLKSKYAFIHLELEGSELWYSDEGGFVVEVSASDCDGKIDWSSEN